MKKLFVLLAVCLLLSACATRGTDTPQNPETSTLPVEPVPVSQPVPMDLPEMDPPKTEPDYDLYISDQPIPTAADGEMTDRIPAFIINNTGKDAEVLLIPYLEKLNENGEWAEVPYRDGVGFCGTPDLLPSEGKEWHWEISMLWGSLEDGQYRIGVQCQPYTEAETTVYGEFTLYTPENSAG